MKRAKVTDGQGQITGIFVAAALGEENRREHEYLCPEVGCSCKVHWRKATRINGNTETRPPVFVKNPSSFHKINCPQDYERIARENHHYTTLIDGQFHVKVNFPLGGDGADRRPSAYLSEAALKDAEKTRHIRPFSSAYDLTRFIHQKLGGLSGDQASDLHLHYQGKSAPWSRVFIPSTEYQRLYARGISNFNTKEIPGRSQSAITIVKIEREIEPNDKGKRRFICSSQTIVENGKNVEASPVVVINGKGDALPNKLEWAAKEGLPVAIASKPFCTGARYGKTDIYLSIHDVSQISQVAETYWQQKYRPMKQLSLFRPGGL